MIDNTKRTLTSNTFLDTLRFKQNCPPVRLLFDGERIGGRAVQRQRSELEAQPGRALDAHHDVAIAIQRAQQRGSDTECRPVWLGGDLVILLQASRAVNHQAQRCQ